MNLSSYWDPKTTGGSDWPSIGESFGGKWNVPGSGYSGGANKFGAKEFLQAFSSGMGQDKYRDWGSRQQPFGYSMGKATPSGCSQVLENLGVCEPSKQAPIFLAGQEGEKSPWGQLAGAALGAASGFIPGVGLAGAALGSQLGGGLGGALFG